MNASSRLTMLTRIGFASRGVLYLVIAYLIFRTGHAEDQSGALAYLGGGSGKLLLGVMAVGLLAYGLWRLSDAAFDIEGHEAGRNGAAERAAAAVSGVVHLLLSWQAVWLIRGASATGDGAEEGARTALELPGGKILLLVAATLLLAAGIFQLVKAAKGSFLEHLDPQVAARPWVRWSGRAGYGARGIVFLICSYFLINAGLEAQPDEAGGMAEAIEWLPDPFDVVVAMGLLAFGLFSLVEARFRSLHDVPVDALARQADNLRHKL
ncbi:DUF1206 domain-containing protein [Sphingomonas sp. MG17]|uniref:DUF1206 domain-containing protein n=1 Tax=Sphingomonas tagetis TaxID=2949092 RepID=A0A9X2HNF9_9SPHN|nr:DUF1206 domain-containing protein [Sphingomonas tagetis]MCP3732509.1 DUF1206 domain-containing protein [Sphingomonas tagetis]